MTTSRGQVVLARLAVRATARSERLRFVALVLSSAVLSLAVAASVGSLKTLDSQRARGLNRTAVRNSPRIPHASTDFLVSESSDVWKGSEYHFMTVQPSPASPLPPGVRQWPSPGQAILSPALAALADREPDISQRFPHRSTQRIALAGLYGPDELYAYVVPRAVLEPDERRGIVKATSWGVSRLNGPISTEDQELPASAVVAALLAFVMGPALITLVLAARCRSAARDRRLLLVEVLGGSLGARSTIAATEVVPAALLGVVVATVGYRQLTRSSVHLPIVDAEVAPGDASLSPTVLLLIAFATVAVAAVIAIGTMPTARRLVGDVRLGNRPSRLKSLRLVPMGVGFLLCAGGGVVGGKPGAQVWLTGAAVLVLGIGPALAWSVFAIGRGVSQRHEPTIAMAGRRLSSSAGNAARLCVAATALTLLALTTAFYMEVARGPQTPTVITGEFGVQIGGAGWRLADARRIAEQLGTLSPLIQASSIDATGKMSAVTLIDCTHRNSAWKVRLPCPSTRLTINSDGYVILPQTAQLVGDTITLKQRHHEVALPNRDTFAVSISDLPPGANPLVKSMFFRGEGNIEQAELKIRNVAYGSVPAAFVNGAGLDLHESPLIVWLGAAFRVGLTILLIGVAISLIDATLSRRKEYESLALLGAQPSWLARLVACELGLSFAASALVSVFVGVILAVSLSIFASGQSDLGPQLFVAPLVLLTALACITTIWSTATVAVWAEQFDRRS
jgi:hypothetical protein